MKVNGEATHDDLSDIPECFHEVVRKYGRDMFATVFNAGMAQHAVEVLAALVEKHRSTHGAHAVKMISAAFNQASNTLITEKGWDAETLAQCDRDAMLAGKALIAAPKIITH